MGRFYVTLGCLALCVGVAVSYTSINALGQGIPLLAQYLLIAPFAVVAVLSMITVFLHGSLEQRREFWAATVVYLSLGFLSTWAYVVDEGIVREKLFEAFMFGQLVAVLALFKTCFHAWGNPTRRESDEEYRTRVEDNRKIRRENWWYR